MSINTSALNSTLQAKVDALDAATDTKEVLLLSKALDAAAGSTAVSDVLGEGVVQVNNVSSEGSAQIANVQNEGATQRASVGAVLGDYTPTTGFKTVGGASIIGSGDIATLPSQSGASGKVLKSDGTNAAWSESGKVLALSSNSYGTRQTMVNTSSRTVFWDALNFVKVKADSKLHITLQIPLGGAGQSYPHFAEGFIKLSTSSYGANGTDIHGPILNTRATSNDMGAGYLANFVYDSTGTNISGTGNVYISIGYKAADAGTLHPSSVWNPNASDQSRSSQSVSYITVTEVDA